MANILVQWLMTGIVALLHPFYVSVIEVDHNPKAKTMEISVRIFTEDFEKTLQKYSTTKVDILAPKDKALLEKQINTYIQGKFHLSINGKPVVLNYLGHEQQQESIWSYFEVENIPSVQKVEVNCNLLYDFEEKQMNIFHVKVNGVEKSYKLDNPATSTSFYF